MTEQRHRRRPRHVEAWLVAAAAIAVYVLVAVTQWRTWHAPSWDLAIFTQLAKAYSQLEAPIVPIKGPEFNLLGDHFHPLLVLLGPVYRVFPSGLTLLVVQAVLVGLSAWPVTALAVRWLGRRPGILLGAAYALSFGLQGAVRSQFHEIAFALPLLTFGLCALLEHRWRATVLWLAPVVLVKEDLGLLVLVLGLLMWWRGAGRAGWGLAAWGAAWFVLATTVVLPALNPRGQWDYTDNLAAGDVLGDPLGMLAELLGPGEKMVTVLLLVLTAGTIGLRSPLLLAAVPTLLWRFAGDVPFYWSWTWHYDAVLMPIAVAALLDAVGSRPPAQPPPEPATAQTPEPAPEPALASASAHAPEPALAPEPASPPAPAPAARRPWTHRTRLRVALTSSLLAIVLTAPGLPVLGLLHPDTHRVPERAAAAHEVLDTVPDGAVVASDISLLAYLVPTTTTLWTGTADNPVAAYYVIDRRGSTWAGNPPADAASYAETAYPGTDYELVLDVADYQVAQLVTDGR